MQLTAFFSHRSWMKGCSIRKLRTRSSCEKTVLLAMKLTTILLLCGLLQVAARTNGQGITLAVKNAPVKEVFRQIQKQTGLNVIVNEKILSKLGKVTVSVKNASVEQVLDICLKDANLTYSIVDGTIVVRFKQTINPEPDENSIITRPPPIDITGTITDANGKSLSGASIKVRGSSLGTSSNEDGYYFLKNVESDAVLEISFVGYQPITIRVNGSTAISVSLKMSVAVLDQIIVRKGYYDEKKATTTGNVSTISAKDIEKQPMNNPLLALQGRVPGVVMSQANGLPGAGLRLVIRGQNSFRNGYDPLYIVDGVPYPATNLPNSLGFLLGGSGTAPIFSAGNPFSYLNPADIESIDILKDADATAIYGSRGANGVILVTTKKGKEGKIKVDAMMQYGFGKVAEKMDVLDRRQYLDMRYEAFKNDGVLPNPATDYDLTLWDTTRNTNWQKALLGGTSNYMDAQVSVSGGSQYVKFRSALTYHKETTVFPGDFNDQKGSAQFQVNGISQNQKFNFEFSNLFTKDFNRLSSSDVTDLALRLPPVAPPLYTPSGEINWAPNAQGIGTYTVYTQAISRLLSRFNTKTDNLVSSATAGYKILPSLELKSSFNYNKILGSSVLTGPLSRIDPYFWPTTIRRSSFSSQNIDSWSIEPQLSYTKNLLKGKIEALLGTTFSQTKSVGTFLDAQGYSSDQLMEDPGSAPTIIPYPSTDRLYKYNALFARLNYNYNDKYIINITGRRDGSSRFGPANLFHNFGAVGLAWVFSKEKFTENLGFISFGKIRTSYGTTGSDQIGDYTYMDTYSADPVGVAYQGVQGMRPDRIFSPDLAWEETKKFEVAVDLGMFKNRVNLSASFYRHRSSNQLVDFSLPSIAGFTSVTKNFDANLQNAGIELDLRTINIETKNFQWNSSFNISANRNKLISVSDEIYPIYANRIGLPLSTGFVYKFLDVNFVTGYYQVLDSKGNVTNTPQIADATQRIDYTPKYTGGFSNTLTYKGLQLDFLFQYVFDTKANGYDFFYLPGFFSTSDGYNQPVSVLKRWQKPGDISDIGRFSQDYRTVQAYVNAQGSDRFYDDASYVRLKNVSLGWQIPDRWKKAARMQTARIFVQGTNLLTFTNYSGLDPETKVSNSLPPLRVITVGIQIGM
jgi:TonB-linked SusC/RagA family outer membrane protein